MDLEAAKVAVYRRLPPALRVHAVRWGTPNFSVGAMGVLTDDGEQILLVKPSYRDGWLPPGGFLGRGEEPVEALERELVEELDLHVTLQPPYRTHVDVARQGVTLVCAGLVPAGWVPRTHGSELDDAAWFPVDALPRLASDFSEGVTDEDVAVLRSLRPSGRPGAARG